MHLLSEETSARIRTLQMVEDALAFRQHRLSLPCSDCAPGRRCIDHAHDEGLVDLYQISCADVFMYAVEGADPAVIKQIMAPSGSVPPTAGALSVMTLTRLRELAADGPVETVFDGRRVMIELDDAGNIAEYPLPERADRPA